MSPIYGFVLFHNSSSLIVPVTNIRKKCRIFIIFVHEHSQFGMKYLIRSIKYFIWFVILFSLIILALMFTGTAGGDVETMFIGGYSAFWKIAAIFAAVAAVYPKFGFMKRLIPTPDGVPADKTVISGYMEALGYIPEKTGPGMQTFRHKSTASKFSRMYEDRITFTDTADGTTVEGLRKDVTRIASGLEHRLNNMSNQ